MFLEGPLGLQYRDSGLNINWDMFPYRKCTADVPAGFPGVQDREKGQGKCQDPAKPCPTFLYIHAEGGTSQEGDEVPLKPEEVARVSNITEEHPIDYILKIYLFSKTMLSNVCLQLFITVLSAGGRLC